MSPNLDELSAGQLWQFIRRAALAASLFAQAQAFGEHCSFRRCESAPDPKRFAAFKGVRTAMFEYWAFVTDLLGYPFNALAVGRPRTLAWIKLFDRKTAAAGL